ncbi:anaphase-promoting complex subunit 5, putative [Phytophthora infestans T30-4]|uniref:Anaphase-promoting complex subunit 5 n=1 Tax=Phytophthora infestans (strain T30-4) TaxID=403677 RepID=D0NJP6_PHYIT|nr:anaphase-promoting complex subunit 5, putative [Phytophthora infestans T30-4]EEY59982.1 anaphase-promoting complex subunit 5, putative [Phytophthora infestans T30-4]|eukprot:XP_002900667.1 anaphase-promoting complex subunit 5, putative [Phytophthora infestans T30-4]
MRKWKANSYLLSVCLLVSEYVRQQQQDAKLSSAGEDSVASLVDAPHTQPAPPVISRTSLNALARFLTLEIQHPLKTNPDTSSRTGFTTLKSLLRRLEISLDNEQDFEQVSWQLVSILTQIKSPDSVCNVVEQISECVTPLQTVRDEEDVEIDVDSANATLVRTSLLGVFVRSFLLEVNRLLFDGLSRLFDDVQQYLEQFREDMEKDKKLEEKDNSLELVGSPASQNLWNEDKMDDDELLLSPIHSGSATPLDSYVLTDKLLTPDAVREVNDPAVWSNDQLNYILSDMIRGMEGGRTAQRSQHIEDQSMEEQLRLLRNKMDGSNPNVLFARYLSFLNDRDYQGALDSLHQYHDVLSPRQNSRGSGLHFRGSGIQYAALNLAGLQILFDHCTAAQESIQEAIRVAQHHGDHICVAFALAWLIRINQKMGNTKDAVLQLVSSCFDRAQELRLPSLQVLATLTEVESDLLRGSTARSETLASTSHFVPHRMAAQAPAPRPLHVWSRLEESLQSIASIATPAANMSNSGTRTMVALQLQAGVASVTDSSNKSGGTGMDWIKSTEAILDTVWSLSGKVAISAAVGWSLYGQRSLEEVFNRIHLLCYEDSAGIGEIALTVSQMAMTVHRLFFLWALQRGEFARAEVHLNAILAFSPDGKDFPAYLDALLLKAALWTAVGDYPRSLELLECIEVTCREHGFTYLHAQVLIATSRTRFQASAPHAPFASLNALLKGVDICTSHHYDLLLAEAHVVMAEVYIAMGKLQDAHSLLNDQMPLVMEHGSIDLRGECLLVLAKTLIASIKRRNEGAKEPTPAATKAIEMLNASTDMFSLVQNVKRLKEISYVQSLVYNHLATQSTKIGGDSTAFYTCREEAAARFLKHNSQLKRAAFRTIEPFFDLELPENIRQSITHRSSEIETVQ